MDPRIIPSKHLPVLQTVYRVNNVIYETHEAAKRAQILAYYTNLIREIYEDPSEETCIPERLVANPDDIINILNAMNHALEDLNS